MFNIEFGSPAKRFLKKELIEAYKSMGKKELTILEEWETASHEYHDIWKRKSHPSASPENN